MPLEWCIDEREREEKICSLLPTNRHIWFISRFIWFIRCFIIIIIIIVSNDPFNQISLIWRVFFIFHPFLLILSIHTWNSVLQNGNDTELKKMINEIKWTKWTKKKIFILINVSKIYCVCVCDGNSLRLNWTTIDEDIRKISCCCCCCCSRMMSSFLFHYFHTILHYNSFYFVSTFFCFWAKFLPLVFFFHIHGNGTIWFLFYFTGYLYEWRQ